MTNYWHSSINLCKMVLSKYFLKIESVNHENKSLFWISFTLYFKSFQSISKETKTAQLQKKSPDDNNDTKLDLHKGCTTTVTPCRLLLFIMTVSFTSWHCASQLVSLQHSAGQFKEGRSYGNRERMTGDTHRAVWIYSAFYIYNI